MGEEPVSILAQGSCHIDKRIETLPGAEVNSSSSSSCSSSRSSDVGGSCRRKKKTRRRRGEVDGRLLLCSHVKRIIASALAGAIITMGSNYSSSGSGSGSGSSSSSSSSSDYLNFFSHVAMVVVLVLGF